MPVDPRCERRDVHLMALQHCATAEGTRATAYASPWFVPVSLTDIGNVEFAATSKDAGIAPAGAGDPSR